jgi:LysR family transcriptional regulator for bpeEF and oprC
MAHRIASLILNQRVIEMDRLQAMRVFSKVVETNSFSRAADSLNLPRASVTVIVKSLEEALRIRLLHRTTRSLSLTPEGALYYERCIRVLADIDEMEATLTQATGTPRGKLRVDLPNTILLELS